MRDNTFYNAAVMIAGGFNIMGLSYSCWAICEELEQDIGNRPRQREWYEDFMLRESSCSQPSSFLSNEQRILALLLADLIYNEK